MLDAHTIIYNAYRVGIVIPAFNVPYLPMVEPVIRAIVDQDIFAFIETARLEWYKFEAKSPDAVMDEYKKWCQPGYVRLHLDHVPAIDEDGQQVDYMTIIQHAIELGYDSVMIDGSRLDLDHNIKATCEAVELAHQAGVAIEAELGAVLGHEAGPPPPYDELFASGRGFTRVEEATRFVHETGCDWLSVAIGNIHGAVSGIYKDQKKPEARLDLEHLAALRQATGIPLVLHGGSGINQDYVRAAFKHGIAKVNVGSDIRQAYETALRDSGRIGEARQAVYDRTCWLIRDYYGLAGTRQTIINQDASQS
ncbi:MAG: class II fructose-bisphosphate aldolase [Anaerolineae bacterium]|nr:class II fructose-bisphosphate aldolase [Anaerolineae bacterium]